MTTCPVSPLIFRFLDSFVTPFSFVWTLVVGAHVSSWFLFLRVSHQVRGYACLPACLSITQKTLPQRRGDSRPKKYFSPNKSIPNEWPFYVRWTLLPRKVVSTVGQHIPTACISCKLIGGNLSCLFFPPGVSETDGSQVLRPIHWVWNQNTYGIRPSPRTTMFTEKKDPQTIRSETSIHNNIV